ncbi:hypothetical protein V8D89_014815 [Ganoderma adspersum]
MKFITCIALSFLFASAVARPRRLHRRASLSLENSADGIALSYSNDPQKSHTLLESSNNFINFCATVPHLPLTEGRQLKSASCNPAPMGIIASVANLPSSKFVSPKNGATLNANTNFTITMAVQHLETGWFVNPDENYFGAPQQITAQGDILGHSHIVVEALPALDSTALTDPSKFVFFKGLNARAEQGVLTAEVAGGLPKGAYRLASINTAANHQPLLVATAQRGALDDMI